MGRSRSTSITALVGIVAIAAGLILSVVLLVSRQRVVDAAPTLLSQSAADVGGDGGTIEENRALKPAVFVGRVVAADGEVDIGIEEPFLVPIYAVDVETSLKGRLPRQVRVAVLTSEPPEELGGDPVAVGDRYLFAAEEPDDPPDVYWIDEGLGSVRIADDAAAAAIVAQYQRLIREVTANPPPPPDRDPCDFIDANPTIDIDPNQGRAGRNVRVSVNRAAGPVTVYWRNRHNRAGREDVRADCGVNVQIRVPGDARPGRYDIIAVDARGKEVHERFHVLDD